MNRPKGEPVAVANVILPYTENRELLSELFRGHYRRVLTAAYRITGSMADAEDVAQAVFLRISAVDGPPVTNAASYLYRAAINGALDLLRHLQSRSGIADRGRGGGSFYRARQLAGSGSIQPGAGQLASPRHRRIGAAGG